jgi:hypothetical protein
MFTLAELAVRFPPEQLRIAVTGLIPMSFANANQLAIAAIVKQEGLRRIYRGPRSRYSNDTRKAVAHSVLLYLK